MNHTPEHATEPKGPPARGARGESRRQQVLDAAAVCFRRNGFRGASMSEISALAGMSTGHIYHYFKNKEAIVEAIIKRDLQEGITFMESLKEADDIVQTLIDGAKDCIVDRNKLSEPALTLEILAEASRNPAISAIMDDCETSIRRSFIEALETGRKRGVIAPDARIDVACTMMMLIFDGITVQSAVNPLFDHEIILKELERLLNQALRPGSGA